MAAQIPYVAVIYTLQGLGVARPGVATDDADTIFQTEELIATLSGSTDDDLWQHGFKVAFYRAPTVPIVTC